MSNLDEIRGDILGETPAREPVNLNGQQLFLEEMDVNQYQRFAEVNEREEKLRAIYEIIIECLYTRDGQRVFKKEHLDSFMETRASDGSPAAVLREKFMQINNLQSGSSSGPEAGDEGN